MELFRIVGTIAIDKAKAIAGLEETAAKAKTTGEKVSLACKTIGQKSIDMGKKLAGVSAGAGMAFGAMVKYASDTEEATNKVDVAFGKSSNEVKKFADTALSQFGIAKGSAMDMAALFGDMGTSMGLSRKEAAEMSTSLVGLAGDLASFKNIGLDQATTALNGIFTGETESLKTLGIVMTQTNLDAYALANGFGKTTSEMTQAEQVALRYAYVMDKTKNAHGDFARTGDSTANQTRKFKESLKELAATFGEVLLPAVSKIVGKANEILKRFSECGDATKIFVVGLIAIAAAASPVLIAFGFMLKAVGSAIDGYRKLSPVINAAQKDFKKLSATITGLPKKFSKAERAAAKTRKALYGSTNPKAMYGITSATDNFGSAMVKVANEAKSFAIETAKSTATTVRDTSAKVANAIATSKVGVAATGATKKIVAFAAANRIALLTAFGLIAPLVLLGVYMAKTGESGEEIAAKITAFSEKLAATITSFAESLPAMIDAVMPAITQTIQSVAAMLPVLIPALLKAGVELFMSLVESAKVVLPQLIDAVIGSISQLVDPLVQASVQLIQAVIEALPILIPALIDAGVTLFMALVEAIPIVASALIDAIPQILQALKTGLADGMSRVWDLIKAKAAQKWNEIKNKIMQPIDIAKQKVKSAINAIKSFFDFGIVIARVKSGFEKVKNNFVKPIEEARSKIKGILNKIKSFFPLSIGKVFKNLKLPKIDVTTKKNSLGIPVPKFTVKWNAKGAIFDQPTIFATPQGFQGVGEAGKEAVAPIDTLQQYVASAVASQNGEMVAILSDILSAIKTMDAGMYQNIETALDNRKIEWNNRELGRFVRNYA